MALFPRLTTNTVNLTLKTVEVVDNNVVNPVTNFVAPAVDAGGTVIIAVTDPLAEPFEQALDPVPGNALNPAMHALAAIIQGGALAAAALPTDGFAPAIDQIDGAQEALAPLYDALDPATAAALDALPDTNGLILLASLLGGVIVGDAIDNTGLEEALGPLVDFLGPVDDLVGEVNFDPIFDAAERLASNLVDPINDVAEVLRAVLPEFAEEIIDGLPSLGVIGETEVEPTSYTLPWWLGGGTVIVPGYEEGGVLSDLDNNVVGSPDENSIDIGGALGADGAGLDNTGDIFDSTGEALGPLEGADIVGDVAGGGNSGELGLLLDTTGVSI